MPSGLIESMKEILGIKMVEGHSNYLGLSSLIFAK